MPGSTTPVAQCYNEHLTYDSNGNILSLFRYGEVDDPNNLIEIDDLEYEYDLGNKLINVVDNTTHSAGFNDGNQKGVNGNTDNDFEYDTFGNLIKDRNKEIDEIVYNHLNLPKKIIFENENTIEYLYDASGTKLRKIVTDNTTSPTTVTITHYLDGFQYIDDEMEFFPTAEGYVKVTHKTGGTAGGGTTASYNYVFNYTDHLGNIRLRYALNEDNWMVILEEDHYYPFGLKHTGNNAENYVFASLCGGPVQLIPTNPDALETYKVKYNQKEWQNELGFNVYDYGARNYMPDLGRYFNMDKFSEAYVDLNSYQYTANNPVKFIDVNGDYIYIHDDENNRYKYDKGKLYQMENEKWVEASVDKGSYVDQIVGFLSDIAGDDENSFGSQFLNLFANDDINVDIRKNPRGEKNGHQFGTVYTSFNQRVRTQTTNGLSDSPFHITLAHELGHGLSFNLIKQSARNKVWVPKQVGLDKDITQDEVFAIMFENMIRSEQGLPLRTHYISGSEGSIVEKSRVIKKSKRREQNPFSTQYQMTEEAIKIYNNLVKNKK